MKKLTLCKTQDAKIFGVCGGIANYFEIDPTVVRLITVLIALTAIGIIPYFIAALLIPNHPENK